MPERPTVNTGNINLATISSALLGLFAAACGERAVAGKVAPELSTSRPVDAKQIESARKRPPSCRQTQAPDISSLCTAWKEHHRQVRVESCSLDQHEDPVVSGEYTMSVLEVLYFTDADTSHMDRFVVLHDQKVWRVVTELGALFGDDWVFVQVRELKDRVGGPPPEIRLETVVRRDVPTDCLETTEEIRSTVLCGQPDTAFVCMRIDTHRQLAASMSARAHPLSSQYSYEEAHRCAQTLSQHGLSADHNYKVLEQSGAALTFPTPDQVRYVSVHGQPVQRSLADLLTEGTCYAAEL